VEPERFNEVFNRGWSAAVQRIDPEGYIRENLGTILPSPETVEREIESFRTDVRSALGPWEEVPLQPRFVEFFIESASVAYIARRLYGHAPLTQDQLQSYLATSVEFFNEWTRNFR
jgi:hypothetical protein